MTPLEVYHHLLGLPREAGTPAAAEARVLLRRHLESRGYTVREQPFVFQPTSLLALPLLGAGLGWLTIIEIPLLMLDRVPGFLAPLVWVMGMGALGVLAWGIGSGFDVPGAERRQDASLIATRGTEPVRRWIVAHVDTKAQGHSMSGRLVAVWVLIMAAVSLTAVSVVRAAWGAVPASTVGGIAALAMVAATLAGLGRLRGTSPGARDNGTGLLAALVAAEARREDGIGFLFSGAEEFGLVGARVFVRSGPVAGVEVVNLDTLTDRGVCCLVFHDGAGRRFASELLPVLESVAPRIRLRRLPLGILVDSLPFARAGARGLTLCRLDWNDLQHLHTARDTDVGLGLTTATAVGEALGRLR